MSAARVRAPVCVCVCVCAMACITAPAVLWCDLGSSYLSGNSGAVCVAACLGVCVCVCVCAVLWTLPYLSGRPISLATSLAYCALPARQHCTHQICMRAPSNIFKLYIEDMLPTGMGHVLLFIRMSIYSCPCVRASPLGSVCVCVYVYTRTRRHIYDSDCLACVTRQCQRLEPV